jgi:hypothetical protein
VKATDCSVLQNKVPNPTKFLQDALTGKIKFPNLQYCFHELLGDVFPAPDKTGKTVLTIPSYTFTIAAGDKLASYLKFSVAKTLQLVSDSKSQATVSILSFL